LVSRDHRRKWAHRNERSHFSVIPVKTGIQANYA
jgi:hypothetical protein